MDNCNKMEEGPDAGEADAREADAGEVDAGRLKRGGSALALA
jgi:hypothetical protein